MKALLRPLFVCGLSIAMAATSLVGTSSVALAANTRPVITDWPRTLTVYEGDRPFINATFTDPDLGDLHIVDIDWGDGTTDRYILPIGDRTFSVQKVAPYTDDTAGVALDAQISLADPVSSTSRSSPSWSRTRRRRSPPSVSLRPTWKPGRP